MCLQRRSVLEEEHSCSDIHKKFGSGFTKEEQETRKKICGSNAIEVHVIPIWKLLFKEVLNPFYVFQAFSISLWYACGYLEYSSVIIFITLLSMFATIYNMRKESVKLHKLVESHNSMMVTVLRKSGVTEEVESHCLVPGDVIVITGKKYYIPCDAILVTGGCIVNEGMLTGESVPVSKTPLPNVNNAIPWKIYSGEDYKRHVLFCGTEVIQTNSPNNDPVKAVVFRTGFNTTKGDLVRSILYPKPVNFKLHRDAIRFLMGLSLIAVAAVIYIAVVYTNQGAPVKDTVLWSLLIITACIPPALPACLTVGILYSQKRLQKAGIFCLSTQRINVCGRLNIICFDKTGTLTEDGMELWGIVPSGGKCFQDVHCFTPGSSLPWGPLLASMVSCHSLILLDGKTHGDPLDMKMFEGTGWELQVKESSIQEGEEAFSNIIMKPGPSAVKENRVLILSILEMESILFPMERISGLAAKKKAIWHLVLTNVNTASSSSMPAAQQEEGEEETYAFSHSGTAPEEPAERTSRSSPPPHLEYSLAPTTATDWMPPERWIPLTTQGHYSMAPAAPLLDAQYSGTETDNSGPYPWLPRYEYLIRIGEPQCPQPMEEFPPPAHSQPVGQPFLSSEESIDVVEAQAKSLFMHADPLTLALQHTSPPPPAAEEQPPDLKEDNGQQEEVPVEGLTILHQFPFSSSLQRMSVIVKVNGGDENFVFMKGAPEMVVQFCTPETVPLHFQKGLQCYTSQGFRVIALAYKTLTIDNALDIKGLERDEVESHLIFLGLLILENKLKPETKPVLQELHAANIRTVMITGDNLQTACTVGRASGMVPDDSKLILIEASAPDGNLPASISWHTMEKHLEIGDVKNDLKIEMYDNNCVYNKTKNFHFAMSGKSYAVLVQHFHNVLPKILLNSTIFARMSPGQKSTLIEDIQKMDYFAGMCGDGANDCGALKSAHAGISLSELEASVASPFTSKTPNIECIPKLIKEGRNSLVTSFCVFKYITMYSMVGVLCLLILFWKQIYIGNRLYLLHDMAITITATLTIKLMGIALVSQMPEEYQEYHDVFDKVQAGTLPPHRSYDCTIDLQAGAIPPYRHVYPLYIAENKAMEKYVAYALSQGFICRSNYPVGAGCIFAKKNGGKLRPCIDNSGLNRLTIKNVYPIPLITGLLDRLKGPTIFTKLDLRGAYNLGISALEDHLRECRSTWVQVQYSFQWFMQHQKTQADHRHLPAPTYHVEERVWLSSRNLILQVSSQKLAARYVSPFRILWQINPVAYALDLPPLMRISNVFYVSLLNPLVCNRFTTSLPCPRPVHVNNHEEYEMVCTPYYWRVDVLIMVAVQFAVSCIVEEGFIENRKLWLLIKRIFNYQSKSQYRKLQKMVDRDPDWPPQNRTDYADKMGTLTEVKAYVNPAFDCLTENLSFNGMARSDPH
ncbi:putative cation-transporting ATPase 13A4 [Rhinophrynus dorsalis]